MTYRERERLMNHLGALGLLANLSLELAGPEAEEWRDCIVRCLRDAEGLGLVRWRRVLSRIEVEPAASAVLGGEP